MDGQLSEQDINRINQAAAAETAAVQKYLSDKKAYEAIASNLPSIEESIARQRQAANAQYSIRPPTFLESALSAASGVYFPSYEMVSNPQAQEQAVKNLRSLEARKSAIESAQRPDLSAVRQAAFQDALPPGVAEIVSQTKPTTQPVTPAPASPTPAPPAPEKPKYDPFSQFREIEDMRRGFFGVAMSTLDQLPAKYHAKAIKAAKDLWDVTGPKFPPNALLPVQNPLTGEMIKGMGMTADGKVVELTKSSNEVPKELSAIATKRAEEISNADESLAQLDTAISYMSDPKISNNDKVTFGKNFLQRFNIIQSQGPNVLGVDEAKRLGGALETRFLNLAGLVNNEQVFGTDLPKFIQQLNDTKMTVQSGRKSSLSTLKRISPNAASYFDGQQQDQPQGQQQASGGTVRAVRLPGGQLTRQ